MPTKSLWSARLVNRLFFSPQSGRFTQEQHSFLLCQCTVSSTLQCGCARGSAVLSPSRSLCQLARLPAHVRVTVSGAPECSAAQGLGFRDARVTNLPSSSGPQVLAAQALFLPASCLMFCGPRLAPQCHPRAFSEAGPGGSFLTPLSLPLPDPGIAKGF